MEKQEWCVFGDAVARADALCAGSLERLKVDTVWNHADAFTDPRRSHSPSVVGAHCDDVVDGASAASSAWRIPLAV